MYRLCFSLAAALLILVGQSPALAVLPLRDQWSAACRALARGEAAQAHALFDEFDHWYGGEPEVRDADFQEGWLRLAGLAALQAGAHEQAVSRLTRWLTAFPDAPAFRAFIRFQLAALHRAMANNEEAASQYEAFLSEFPGLPECALVHWMWADLHLSFSRYARAREHLRAVLETEELPASGRQLASAALAMVELAEGKGAEAYAWLHLDSGGPPLPALRLWRALLAPALVRQLMQAEHFTEAGNATAWLDRPENLLQTLQSIRASFNQGRRPGVRQAVWHQHWTGQVTRLENAVAGANENAASTAHLYALRLRSLLKARAAQKAHILASALLRSPSSEAEAARAEAYAGIIEACHLLDRWQEASHYADAFLGKFPDDPALPEILFLQARTAAGQQKYSEARQRADSLIAAFPEHRARRSWEVAAAGWCLQAGAAGDARSRFTRIRDSAPAAWHPYLDFQAARCLVALKQSAEADVLFCKVADSAQASAVLQEQAVIERLKLKMSILAHEDFVDVLGHYGENFPDGLHRLIVGNLAGTHFRQTGNLEQAIAAFHEVASAEAPASLFAREQLSGLYAASNRFDDLRGHALGWIRSSLAGTATIPDRPFADLLECQEQLQQPVLPPPLLSTLLESLDASSRLVPALACLPLLASQWDHYAALVNAQSESFDAWIDQRAAALYEAEQFPAYAAYQLLAAARLEAVRRLDSADARRIRVLQITAPGMHDAPALQAIAETAHRYDFPEAAGLLEEFLQRFPDHPRRPQVLLLMADVMRPDQPAKAEAVLQEILTRWSDSSVYPQASLTLARSHLQAGEARRGLQVVETLLDRHGLAPGQIAEALLLRTRGAFLTGDFKTAVHTSRRLLTLYPDLHDSIQACALLLSQQARDSTDPDLKETIHAIIRETLPDFRLSEV